MLAPILFVGGVIGIGLAGACIAANMIRKARDDQFHGVTNADDPALTDDLRAVDYCGWVDIDPADFEPTRGGR
jgi:hypothetical protein